jgi:hypothetical protein
MSSQENPRSLSELCDWLETNHRELCKAINQAPTHARRTASASWDELLHDVHANPDDDGKFVQFFESFLGTLIDIPSVGSTLPPGFGGYLLLVGRQPTLPAAQEIRRRFARVLLVLNESILAEDEERAEADSPTTPRAEDPGNATAHTATPEAQS